MVGIEHHDRQEDHDLRAARHHRQNEDVQDLVREMRQLECIACQALKVSGILLELLERRSNRLDIKEVVDGCVQQLVEHVVV